MIATAGINDNIIPLFNSCFSDDHGFNNYFFNSVYRPENTLLYKTDGRIAATLQMFYYETNIGQTMYLFGVCTDVNYRRQGLSTKLINRAIEIARQNGCISVILIPEQDWLFDFYGKLGFSRSFFCNKKTIHTAQKNTIKITKLSYADTDDILDCYYKNMTSDMYIKRDHDFYKLQIDFYNNLAVKYMDGSKFIGYSFGTKEDNVLVLDELVATDYNLCLNAYENSEITYTTPNGDVPLGMLKLLGEDRSLNGYINLLFN